MDFSKIELNNLKKLKIFSNFSDKDLNHMLKCSGAYYKTYEKNDIIYFENDPLIFLGIIVSGSVRVEKVDSNGNNTYIIDLFSGNFLGEYLALNRPNISPYTYIAANKCKLLCLAFYGKLSSSDCKRTCLCRMQFGENMLNQICDNNMAIATKLYILSKKSIREKILAFLTHECEASNTKTISLNFTKSKLAEYLCVNRSALVRELSNMKAENLIDFDKNTFTLL